LVCLRKSFLIVIPSLLPTSGLIWWKSWTVNSLFLAVIIRKQMVWLKGITEPSSKCWEIMFLLISPIGMFYFLNVLLVWTAASPLLPILHLLNASLGFLAKFPLIIL
jgi:hypothetical protein